MKGVGRFYRRITVDTRGKVAFARRYATKSPIAAADMLNDRVPPFYRGREPPPLSILTDRADVYR